MENIELLKKISEVISQEKTDNQNDDLDRKVQMSMPRWLIKLIIWALKLLIEFLEGKLKEPK